MVFILASGEEKRYFRVVSVGHLMFDCRMYCGLSRRMPGSAMYRIHFSLPKVVFCYAQYQKLIIGAEIVQRAEQQFII